MDLEFARRTAVTPHNALQIVVLSVAGCPFHTALCRDAPHTVPDRPARCTGPCAVDALPPKDSSPHYPGRRSTSAAPGEPAILRTRLITGASGVSRLCRPHPDRSALA